MSRFSFMEAPAFEYSSVAAHHDKVTSVIRILMLCLLVAGVSGAEAREIASPAGSSGLHPFLTVSNGRLIMSWTEPAGDGHAVKTASFAGGRWSEPAIVVQRDDLFVNWADFPSIIATADGTLFAHWLQKSSSGTY